MKEHSYMAFLQEAKQFIPQERIYTDELRRLAFWYGCRFLPTDSPDCNPFEIRR